jgi:hypothetical protein
MHLSFHSQINGRAYEVSFYQNPTNNECFLKVSSDCGQIIHIPVKDYPELKQIMDYLLQKATEPYDLK